MGDQDSPKYEKYLNIYVSLVNLVLLSAYDERYKQLQPSLPPAPPSGESANVQQNDQNSGSRSRSEEARGLIRNSRAT